MQSAAYILLVPVCDTKRAFAEYFWNALIQVLYSVGLLSALLSALNFAQSIKVLRTAILL